MSCQQPRILVSLALLPLWLFACAETTGPKDGPADTGGPAPEACPGDTDCDGLTDTQEPAVGTDPSNPDSDGDGIGDFEELLGGTNPLDADTDGDGMPDNEDENPGVFDLPDADDDGLPDEIEEILGTDPNKADTDGDGLSDLDELIAGADPHDTDTDGDGLSDGDEASAGTDPTERDTDGDGLSDGDEVYAHGSSPLSTDTDGDGADDLTEVLSGSDADDPESVPPTGPGAGDVVRCERAGLTQAEGRNFYDAAIAAGMGTAGARPFYADWDPSRNHGTECSCKVVLTDPTMTAIQGVSVWIPSRVHAGTEWESNPLPAGLMLDVPPTWPDAERRLTVRTERNYLVDDLGEEVDHWFAFDDIASNPDTEENLYVPVPFDPSGTFTIWVSYANTSSQPMEGCDALVGGADDDPADSLHFRLDTPGTLAARFVPPAGEPVPEPLACTPGVEAITVFTLADLGEGTQPLVTGGAPAFVGARIREVRVTDWRGADRLEVRRPSGTSAVLTPAQPAVLLGAHDLPLREAQWHAGRSTAGTWRAPRVEVRHACPAPPKVTRPAQVMATTWSDIDAALRMATGGIGLELWQDGLGDSPVPALRAYLEQGERLKGDPDHLVFEAPGARRLDALLLSEQAPGSWTFHHRRHGLQLDGTVVRSGNDLLLTVLGGTVEIAGAPLVLSPSQLLLVGGTAQ